jgi:SOS-response transcriptional repressor LexA
LEIFTMSGTPHERLVEARAKAGYRSAREAVEKLGWGYSTYASHENGSRRISPDAARKYARVFSVSAAWLLYGTERDKVPEPVSVPVVGKVAAGLWQEADSYTYDDDTWVPAVRSPEFRNGRQVAYKVEGPSMNKVLPDGVYAIGVLFETARQPRHKDIVVLKRTRAGLVETTVKRYIVDGDNILLMPESDDPRYQAPIDLRADEAESQVELHALVVGSYKPL